MDEKQKYIEMLEQCLAEIAPKMPEEERRKRIKKMIDRKFGSNSLPQTDTHA